MLNMLSQLLLMLLRQHLYLWLQTEESGRLQSMGSQTITRNFTFTLAQQAEQCALTQAHTSAKGKPPIFILIIDTFLE